MECMKSNSNSNIGHIESSCFFNAENSFQKFQIDSADFLNDITQRSICPACNKSRRYYCYTCYIPMQIIENRIPKLKLPIKIDILKHPREIDGKSTAAHAAVIAPHDVKVYVHPDIPTYDFTKTLLVFPGKNAVMLEKWLNDNKCSSFCDKCDCSHDKESETANSEFSESFNDQKSLYSQTCSVANNKNGKLLFRNVNSHQIDQCLPFDKVVFIDSTWNQSRTLYNDKRVKCLPCVILTSHTSSFWRHQRGKPSSYLATIEAVYYFLVDLHNFTNCVPYNGQYDNLLFFFKFMYDKIRTLYDPSTLRAYKKMECS